MRKGPSWLAFWRSPILLLSFALALSSSGLSSCAPRSRAVLIKEPDRPLIVKAGNRLPETLPYDCAIIGLDLLDRLSN